MGNHIPSLNPPQEREHGEWGYKGPEWAEAKESPNLILRFPVVDFSFVLFFYSNLVRRERAINQRALDEVMFHARARVAHDRLAYCFRKHSFVNGWELCREEIEEHLKRTEMATPGYVVPAPVTAGFIRLLLWLFFVWRLLLIFSFLNWFLVMTILALNSPLALFFLLAE
jgi:hypothetical protein